MSGKGSGGPAAWSTRVRSVGSAASYSSPARPTVGPGTRPALRHYEAHGDGDCPVCGRPGALTGQWRQATEQEVARLGQEAQDAEDAERAAAEARRHALTLVQPSPLGPVGGSAAGRGSGPGAGRVVEVGCGRCPRRRTPGTHNAKTRGLRSPQQSRRGATVPRTRGSAASPSSASDSSYRACAGPNTEPPASSPCAARKPATAGTKSCRNPATRPRQHDSASEPAPHSDHAGQRKLPAGHLHLCPTPC
jgi:hypothetical protein